MFSIIVIAIITNYVPHVVTVVWYEVFFLFYGIYYRWVPVEVRDEVDVHIYMSECGQKYSKQEEDEKLTCNISGMLCSLWVVKISRYIEFELGRQCSTMV